MFEKICHTLGGLDGRYHQKVCIHVGKINFISGVADELRQKHALGPAVALSERVQGIGDAIEINDFLYELVMGQILEIVAAPQPFKNQLRLTFDVFSRGKLGSLLADVHGADFASPFIQVREEKTVNGFVVVKVKGCCLRSVQPFRISCRGDHALDLAQLFFIADIKLIDEDGRAGVTVGRDRVDAVSHITPPLRDGPESPLSGRPPTLLRS